MSNKLSRLERFMPSGTPRYILAYDSPDYIDRYTVIYTKKSVGWGRFTLVSMSGAPFHPQGFCQHSEIESQRIGKHLGKRIKFADLPEDCQRVVIDEYKEIWGLK